MSLLLFLRGLVGVLVVFAATTYYLTQSVWSTVVQTAICAVLLQIGYFVAVLIMIWRSGPRQHKAPESSVQSKPEKNQATVDAAELPRASRSRNS